MGGLTAWAAARMDPAANTRCRMTAAVTQLRVDLALQRFRALDRRTIWIGAGEVLGVARRLWRLLRLGLGLWFCRHRGILYRPQPLALRNVPLAFNASPLLRVWRVSDARITSGVYFRADVWNVSHSFDRRFRPRLLNLLVFQPREEIRHKFGGQTSKDSHRSCLPAKQSVAGLDVSLWLTNPTRLFFRREMWR